MYVIYLYLLKNSFYSSFILLKINIHLIIHFLLIKIYNLVILINY